MGSELEDDLGDFDAGGSTNSDNDKVDSILIKKILSEMKSEFNRGMCSVPYQIKEEPEDNQSSVNLTNSVDSDNHIENGHTSDSESVKNDLDTPNEPLKEDIKEEPPPPEESLMSTPSYEEPADEIKDDILNEESDSVSNVDSAPLSDETVDVPKKKTRINKDAYKVKPSPEPDVLEDNISAEKKGRRSLRNVEKSGREFSLKRSSRRMSKEYSRESVLQNAIARKEKSFSSLNSTEEKHRRSIRLSDDKNSLKLRSTTRSSIKGLNDEQGNKGASDIKSFNGKTIKSPSISSGDINDNDNSHDSSAASTPKKVVKSHASQLENGFDDFSNNVPNNLLSENDWEKGTDSSSNFSTTSCKAKKKKFSFTTESYHPPAKKNRLDASPLGAEANEVPFQEPSFSSMSWTKGNCECQKDEGLYASKSSLPSPCYCKALDTFENMVVGCCSIADSDAPLIRPSRLIPLLPMCPVHIARLLRHNCCPSCGLFCTQGYFFMCSEAHLFHKDCELKKDDQSVCPHCSTDEFKEIKLTVESHQYPIFLPMQKLPKKEPSAKMSISKRTYQDLELKDENELSELLPQKELLLNRKKFSTDGLPPGEKEKLENILHAFFSRNELPLRFSSRAFYQACKHGDTDKVLSMIGGNIKESSIMALHAAAGNGHLLIVHILVQSGLALETLDKSQYTPLMLAALNGHNKVVKYLVKSGADVAFKGSDGMTALHLAAKIGNVEACHYLLSAANRPLTYVDSLDDGQWTPLVWAAENRHSDVVRYLLEKKADPQIRDSEMNVALHWSAFSGSMAITEDLLNYGSNINLPNVHGDTPLHIAARQGADDCVMLLLARGALTNSRNKAGQLPKDCVLPEFTFCKAALELNMKIKSLVNDSLLYPRILTNDISRGKEQNPIQVINSIDDDPVPSDFTYVTENCITSNLPIDRRITTLTGCKCDGGSCTTSSCKCTNISLRCWYDSRGKLLPDFNFEDPPMLFECNQTCECNALACKNRVVQRGLKVKLQVLKTKNKNWGVITLREIPKGTYVCEYIGEIISDCEADTREDDSYLFDLDNRDGESYCLDARKYGNVTRFVNHSCKPNLVPVRIFVGHHDLHFPRIAFFAGRDIAPNEELSFDYGEKFWVIKYKKFTCACEELNCRYSSVTIHDTLEKYKEKCKLEESLNTCIYFKMRKIRTNLFKKC